MCMAKISEAYTNAALSFSKKILDLTGRQECDPIPFYGVHATDQTIQAER